MIKDQTGSRHYQIASAVILCIGTLAFSAQTVVIKHAGSLITVWQVSFARWFFGALSMIMIGLLFRVNILGRNRLGLILRGLMSTIGFILLVKAVQLLPVSVATVLFFSFPAWSALLSPMINQEPIPKWDWILICGAFTGTCLILLTGFDSFYSSWGGKFFALGAGFCIGLSQNLVRRLRRIEPYDNAFSIFFYFCIVGLIVSCGPLLFQQPPIAPKHPGFFILVILAVLAMLGQLSIGIGLKYISAPKSGVIQMLQVVVVEIYGVAVFNEILTQRLLIGSALIIGCCVVLTLRVDKTLAIDYAAQKP